MWWIGCLDGGLLSLWVLGPSLCSHHQGKLLPKNDLQASLFKQYVSKHTECRESYIPSRKVRQQWRVCFQASIYQELSRFLKVRPPGLPQGPNFPSHGIVFPYIFCGLKKHSHVVPGMPMKKQAAGVCLKVLIAILWLPRRCDLQLEKSQQLAITSCLFASEIPKGRAMLSLSEVRKELLDGVSRSC